MLVVLSLLAGSGIGFAAEAKPILKLCPFKAGQRAEYQIIGLQNKNKDDRYRISVLGKEVIDGREYFWIQYEIFGRGQRMMSFKALISPYKEDEFNNDPARYVSGGMLYLLENAKQLFVCAEQKCFYREASPHDFFACPELLKGSFYENTPYEKNRVDYSKLKIYGKKEDVSSPAGDFSCDHLAVETGSRDPYTDEGLDLWRSERVPFLGIVRMEFSKTGYREKQKYRYLRRYNTADWRQKIYMYFFMRQPENGRNDIFIMRLLSYDAGE